MNNFWKVSPWLTRLLLLPPAAIFTLIGVRNLSDITSSAMARGIVFTSGFGTTVGRVGFGALPLACAIFVIACLFSERRLLTALGLVGILDSVVLLVRVVSMYVDHSVAENLGLVRAEIVLLSLVVAGVFLEYARKRRKLLSQLRAA